MMAKPGSQDHGAPPRESFERGQRARPDPVRGGEAGSPPAHEADDLPSAGPHAGAGLTNSDATPGTGALPSASDDDDVDAASG
jgi:hypothetical protein